MRSAKRLQGIIKIGDVSSAIIKMSWFSKIGDWMDERLESNTYPNHNPFDKPARKDRMHHLCVRCGNNKAWHKNGQVKCTKCGEMDYV